MAVKKPSSYWNEHAETLSRDHIHTMQATGLRALLDHVMAGDNMYSRRLKAAGVNPADIRTPEDFSALVPLTSKDDLRDEMQRTGQAMPHLCVPRSEIRLAGPSAGTSGSSTYQAFTAADLDTNIEMIARMQWAGGFRPDDVLFLMTTPFAPWAHIAREAAKKIGINWIIFDDHVAQNIARYTNTIRNLRPTVMHCGLSTLRSLTADPNQTSLGDCHHVIISGAELGPEARIDFRNRLGLEVTSISGHGSDFNLFAVECDQHDGDHWVGEENAFVEIVDPDTGVPVSEGEIGEMVITDFYRRATPHLRWRTEDLFVEKTGACACGRTGRRFTCLGRASNRVTAGGCHIHPYQVEASLARVMVGRNREFALIRHKDDPGFLDLRVVEATHTEADKAAAETIKTHLGQELGTRVRVRFVPKLPMVGYKTLRVIGPEMDPAPA